MDVKLFFRCLFSPSLYTIHRGNPAIVGKYDPNEWERWGDNLLTSFVLFYNLTVYTSPFLVFLMARRGYFTAAGALSIAKISIGVGVLVGASYCLRSIGRSSNSKYRVFLETLDKSSINYNSENKRALKSYDFEFSAWPVDYDTRKSGEKKPQHSAKRSWFSILSPCSMFSYAVVHTFGIKLIYPGSIQFLGYIMSTMLQLGRNKLVANDSGERFKIVTLDGNSIDTMFVDRRSTNETNGKTLVICSEGNAGFYEIGIMATPLENGNSVLGWNHPGFGGSTGLPYTDQEENAVDAIMQFAFDFLGFKPENVVMFGWSIGGYSTALGAMKNPELKAVVIDASFDDLLPLAIPRMPAILEPLVKQTIRLQANLDVARKLIHYPGPIQLIRRSEDEVICLELNVLLTNRGNDLLVAVLRYRYPYLFDPESEKALWRWLAVTGNNQTQVLQNFRMNEERCKVLINSYLSVSESSFPYQLGDGMDSDIKSQLLLYYASRYLIDYASTHCTPLPLNLFRIPEQSSPDN